MRWNLLREKIGGPHHQWQDGWAVFVKMPPKVSRGEPRLIPKHKKSFLAFKLNWREKKLGYHWEKHLIVIGRSQQIMLIISFSSSIIRSPTLDPHNIGILSANPFLNTNFPSQSSDTSLREEKLKDLTMNQGNSDENIP